MTTNWECVPENNAAGAWITIGAFDGVHLGHQAIIRTLVEKSHQAGQASIVVTFFPHPAKVLRDTQGPYYLTSPEEKNQILKTLGVDSILTLHFDHSLASKSADSFIRILHNQLQFTCLLIGYDFRLGANRSGNIHTLSALGKELGYCVRAIEPFSKTTQPVSSSLIRENIRNGDLHSANNLLGRPYSVEGCVIHGDGRGKHIGLPTANLDVWHEKLLPGGGVYATFADLGSRRFRAVVNIGNRPTFYEEPFQQTIEAHLLDFDQDIYDQKIRLSFIERIRPEMKFDSAQNLMVQIRQDIQYSREVLTDELSQTNLSA